MMPTTMCITLALIIAGGLAIGWLRSRSSRPPPAPPVPEFRPREKPRAVTRLVINNFTWEI